MSKKRIRHILAGKEMEESSNTEDDEEEDDNNEDLDDLFKPKNGAESKELPKTHKVIIIFNFFTTK